MKAHAAVSREYFLCRPFCDLYMYVGSGVQVYASGYIHETVCMCENAASFNYPGGVLVQRQANGQM